MRFILDKIASNLKKEEFKLDKRIPIKYLIDFIAGKIFSLIWGMIVFRTYRKIFLHFSSVLKCKSKISFQNNLLIEGNCYINALSVDGIIFGNNVSLGRNTTIECTGNIRWLGKGLKVGNNVGLGTHGFYGCAGGVEIGSDTIIGNYVSFHSENHNYSDISIPIRSQGVNHKGICVGNNCWVGAKATFLDGSTVGNGCIIAAGAVVRGNFPDNCIIGGIPAKILKFR